LRLEQVARRGPREPSYAAPVRIYRWAAIVLVVVALTGAGAGVLGAAETSFHAYQVAAVGSARAAHNALDAAELTGEAVLARRVSPPYAETRLLDSRTALGGAAERLAGVELPDERCERIRDELRPLLARANVVLSVIESAVTEQNVADIVPVAEALDAFVRAHR
jgi:hypothetical protein